MGAMALTRILWAGWLARECEARAFATYIEERLRLSNLAAQARAAVATRAGGLQSHDCLSAVRGQAPLHRPRLGKQVDRSLGLGHPARQPCRSLLELLQVAVKTKPKKSFAAFTECCPWGQADVSPIDNLERCLA
jgi:hypothetical protein